ncbi:hypothetical protein HMPREF9019_2092 [Hoylesella timonensis CRIS 5C-B1]|uniref:Uncharacterized protein n=1 Tax=Hoylesella timonensis CRIS 5C-B1 TaxID=679189 RepID=D1VZR6_9BACT|nr:hypothetical protein HMPREF9019_2092 [Hoylesella timonensis CRIS 5C-B1]
MMLHWVECIHVGIKTSQVGEMRNSTISTCEATESVQRKGVL